MSDRRIQRTVLISGNRSVVISAATADLRASGHADVTFGVIGPKGGAQYGTWLTADEAWAIAQELLSAHREVAG